jgi:hypothetical protein
MNVRKSIACALLLLAPLACAAQASRVVLPDLSRLESEATEMVDISLDSGLLRLAARFMGDKTAEEKAAKEILSGLRGIYVKSYSFDSDNAYSKADIDPVRRHLSSADWSRLVTVRSHRERADVEVYMRTSGTKVDGMVIVTRAPRALSIVNIVGSVDLEKLRQLEGKFGVPQLGLDVE